MSNLSDDDNSQTRSALARVRWLGAVLGEGSWPRALILLFVGLLLFVTFPGESLPWFLGAWMRGVSQVVLRLVVIFLLGWILFLEAKLQRIQEQVTSMSRKANPPSPSPPQPPSSPPPRPPSSPPSHSVSAWMQGAYEKTIEQLRDLEAQWIDQCRGQARSPASSAEGEQVAEIAAGLASMLRRKNTDPVSVRNLEQMASRLRATSTAPGDDPTATFRQQVPRPLSPAVWLERSQEERDYIENLSASTRRAKELLESVPASDQPVRVSAWRSSAEQLLYTVASRRPAEGEADPDGVHPMHEGLLRLLGWKEILVHRGDAVNRDLHDIESMRGTIVLPPNRVLEVISSGYRDATSGEVVRKAKVVLSQQKLG